LQASGFRPDRSLIRTQQLLLSVESDEGVLHDGAEFVDDGGIEAVDGGGELAGRRLTDELRRLPGSFLLQQILGALAAAVLEADLDGGGAAKRGERAVQSGRVLGARTFGGGDGGELQAG